MQTFKQTSQRGCAQQRAAPFTAGRRAVRAHATPSTQTVQAQAASITKVAVKEFGAASLQGTVRKVNEDRYDARAVSGGALQFFAGVYDGHGGSAVAEWCKNNLLGVVQETWKSMGSAPQAAITEAYLAADKTLLSKTTGFLGMGERGVGGSKCGATAANVSLYLGADGATQLLTSNIGDARILLIRGGKPVQLSEDHVPDSEAERKRIERTNPNPKNPLVRFVGGTWRVGGLLALSRAFGDAYLKGSLQFEGINAGGDGYSSGFGLIAEPYTTVTTLSGEDSYLVVASDGLFAEEERGGGGGLDNDVVAAMCAAGSGLSCEALAAKMAKEAQKVGSTDDVTLVVMRLGSA